MRNLSKVLALVLSLAFVLTMLSGAIYVPAADVDYSDFAELSDAGKKAVNTLSALGIVNGMPDNSFEGARNVKRSEYAKMIDVAKTGKTGDDDFNAYAFDGLDKLFSDVEPAAWYSGYVNYAFLNYILAGYGNGLMKPEAPVTGLEAAKMTLVALGYNPKTEGLEGIEWKKNTLRLATDAGLLKNLDKEVIEGAFDREATAIMIYNALNAQTVSYVDGKVVKGDVLAKIFGGIGQEYFTEPAAKDIAADAKYFLDGKEITAADLAKKAYYFEKAIDDNGDKLIDKLYYVSYNGKYDKAYEGGIYEVADVDGNTLSLAGYGDVDVIDAADIAAGDWVKLSKSSKAEALTARKLAAKTGVIVAYSDNSSNESGDTGLGTTKVGGTYTVKFADDTTAKFQFANLKLTADEIAYWEAIIGEGSAAVQNGIKLNYILDGSTIITFYKSEETYWDGYAIVLETGTTTTLGMESVRLYTDDNEIKDYWVASYNGNQIYNNIATWNSISNALVNSLVKYEEIGNGQIYLYSADYANASSNYTDALSMTFDIATGKWEAYDATFAGAQNSVTYAWDNATIFVSYNKPYNTANASTASNDNAPYVDVDTARRAKQWRAYRVGEFQPATALEVSLAKAGKSEVLFAKGLNNVNVIKAAAITFEHARDTFVLPGLPLRAAEKWGTVMSLTSVTKADGSYNYEVEILLPYSEYYWQNGKLATTETIKLSNPGALTTFNVGDIYKFFMDEDGVARRFEVAATAASKGQIENTAKTSSDAFGSNYLEIFNASYISMTKDANGYALKVEYPNFIANTFTTAAQTLYVTEATDIFFTENLFDTSIKAGLAESTAKADLSKIKLDDYHVYADINWNTMEAYAIWFEKDAESENEVLTLKGVSIETKYDYATEEVTYTLNFDGVRFADGTKSVSATVKPYALKTPVGKDNKVDITIKQNAAGNWFIDGMDAIKSYTWKLFDKTADGKYTFGDNVKDIVEKHVKGALKFYTEPTTGKENADIRYTRSTQWIWFRDSDLEHTNEIRLTDGYIDGKSAIHYNYDRSSGTAYDYEQTYVMVDSDGDALMVVFVDLDTVDATDWHTFPYYTIRPF